MGQRVPGSDEAVLSFASRDRNLLASEVEITPNVGVLMIRIGFGGSFLPL